jgi:hypothetical protein
VFVTVEDQLASLSLTDGTEQASGTYTGTTTSGSGGYYDDWDSADDHGSNDLEYVREAVTDQDALPDNTPRSNSESAPTSGAANDLATGDPSLILDAPAAGGETEVAQELNEALQQEAERFEQDRRQLIETLDEVSDLLRCG